MKIELHDKWKIKGDKPVNLNTMSWFGSRHVVCLSRKKLV